MTRREACVALNLVPQMGPVRLRRLLDAFGEPQAILGAPADRLAAVDGLPRGLVRALAGWKDETTVAEEIARAEAAGISILTQDDGAYPRLLREIHDPPIVLYVWGELLAADAHGLGIVGARQCTRYGEETAKQFGYQLAAAGFTVWSGLARGIDTAAHLGALAAKGRTVAVMGGGLAEIFPPQNFALAEAIAGGGGAVVSEFPMLRQPDRQTFPMRNRIIAGACHGVLVVEAGTASGALHSAHFAAESGRAVFAIPGQVNKPTSHGTNRLIQTGAKLVLDVADILQELPALFPTGATAPPAAGEDGASPATRVPAQATKVALATPEERVVFAAIGDEETPIDAIIAQAGLPTAVVSATLFTLEMKRAVKQLPGKHFVKLG